MRVVIVVLLGLWTKEREGEEREGELKCNDAQK
jgi:hypothetical protein